MPRRLKPKRSSRAPTGLRSGASELDRSNQLDQCFAHFDYFLVRDPIEEWQCERTRRLELGNRKNAFSAGARPINGLQVNRSKVPAHGDPAQSHLVDDPIAMVLVEPVAQSDCISEPTDFATGQSQGRQLQVWTTGQ